MRNPSQDDSRRNRILSEARYRSALSLPLLVKVVVLEVSRIVGGFYQSYSAMRLRGPTGLDPVLSGIPQPRREACGSRYSNDFGLGSADLVMYHELE